MKKLLIILLFFISSFTVNAQLDVFTAGLIYNNFYYKNIENDTLNGFYNRLDSVSLDMNQDNQNDFVISRYFDFSAVTHTDEFYIKSINGCNIAVDKTIQCDPVAYNYNIGKIFTYGDTINSTDVNYQDTKVYMAIDNMLTGWGTCYSGCWNTLYNKFIGVEITENNQTIHDAWIRLGEINCYPAANKVIIYDYCLNKKNDSIPDLYTTT
ncbi:MAG: hypothetical protein ACOYMA_19225 [Bacteroidia bacterium]